MLREMYYLFSVSRNI